MTATATATEPTTATQEAPQGERPNVQRVAMSRAELELYVREGRPTGLLLRSVAMMKGLSEWDVATSAGLTRDIVEAVFEDKGVASIRRGVLSRVADVLGVDLNTMRLATDQVHVLQLKFLPRSRAKAAPIMRGVGLLMRGARAAELDLLGGFAVRMANNGKFHVVNNEFSRVLFVGNDRMFGAKFDLRMIPSGSWVRGNRAMSRVEIHHRELIDHLLRMDLVPQEFSELFMEAEAPEWDDVHVAARVNGVSKSAILEFIRNQAEQAEEAGEAEEFAAIVTGARRPVLRLVESEPKAAAGGAR